MTLVFLSLQEMACLLTRHLSHDSDSFAIHYLVLLVDADGDLLAVDLLELLVDVGQNLVHAVRARIQGCLQ